MDLEPLLKSEVVQKLIEKPPVVLLAFVAVWIVFAAVSPFFTLAALRFKEWFGFKVDTAIRWFNFIYLIVAGIAVGLVVTEVVKLRRVFVGPNSIM